MRTKTPNELKNVIDEIQDQVFAFYKVHGEFPLAIHLNYEDWEMWKKSYYETQTIASVPVVPFKSEKYYDLEPKKGLDTNDT